MLGVWVFSPCWSQAARFLFGEKRFFVIFRDFSRFSVVFRRFFGVCQGFWFLAHVVVRPPALPASPSPPAMPFGRTQRPQAKIQRQTQTRTSERNIGDVQKKPSHFRTHTSRGAPEIAGRRFEPATFKQKAGAQTARPIWQLRYKKIEIITKMNINENWLGYLG